MSDEIDLDSYYANFYGKINVSAINGSLAFNQMHRFIESEFQFAPNLEILEIGINSGEHFEFVKKPFKKYVGVDIRNVLDEPTTKDYFLKNNIEFCHGSVEELPLQDASFDRVIITCVLHHLVNPERALSEVRRVVRQNGTVTILLPNDPGLLYRSIRALTTLRKARRHRLYREVQLIHAREHKNHFLSLRVLIKEVFAGDRIIEKGFPFLLKGYNMNALSIFEIRNIKSD